jgi:SRSO17 transposase
MFMPTASLSVRKQSLSPSAGVAAERFAEYVAYYDDLFARADQREWFRVYVLGLLGDSDRKNVESIATTSSTKKTGGNLGQALQHFITDSPWDHSRVLARYRERLDASVRDGPTAWVIHDGVLPKKGKNSVGAQRQFARSLGRKVNCQVAVVVGVTGTFGYAPLTARLYLPGYWLREHPELAEKTVPADHRRHLGKTALARELVDELRAEGWAAERAAADEGYAPDEVFPDVPAADATHLATANERFEWLKTRLGLDHFEGRTWTGWHHHLAMVLVAAGFLLLSDAEQQK